MIKHQPGWRADERVWRPLCRASAVFWAVFAGLVLAGGATACDPDPTDDAHYSHITFVNDTTDTAVLYECADDHGTDCHDMTGPMNPGEKSDQRQWAEPGAVEWQVRTPQGKKIGSLLVESPVRESGAVYPFSDAVRNPVHVTVPHGTPTPDPMP